MSYQMRDPECTKCGEVGGGLLMLSYTQDPAPDIWIDTNGGGFFRPGHDRPDPDVEYMCLRCDATYAHECFVMSDADKAKYPWTDSAEGKPVS